MFGGLWKEKKKHHFHLFSLSRPTILLEPSFFSLILKFYFTMVLNRYFMPVLLFPWPINYNHTSWCTKFSTHSLSNWFWLKIFFFLPWIHGVAHDHFLWASSYINEWITASEVFPKFDINTTSSWWKPQTIKWRAPKSRGETHLRVSQSQVAESWDSEARSRLPTLERGRGSSWEPRD
jgi:hypothetical protein